MISKISERTLYGIRGALLIFWSLLILSLFWDPITVEWTKRGLAESWFWCGGQPSVVQGRAMEDSPHGVGARVFWTILIPLLPIFIMVLGHNSWRRLCPLSFLSQIPGYLGLQRKTPGTHRPQVLGPKSPWRRRAWLIQFALLIAGLAARLFLINSDRLALGLFLIATMVAAMVVGALWGGKAWCHYICPVGVVEMIYTGHAGLLQHATLSGGSPVSNSPVSNSPVSNSPVSNSPVPNSPVPNSMCRRPGPTGDAPSCVGCVRACPDIDQTKSYVMALESEDVRISYYGLLGLILGFYGYYYLYAGNWYYYFSGDWTHPQQGVGDLLSPGFFMFGQALPIPKFVAATVTLLVSVYASWKIGCGLESAVGRWLHHRGRPLPPRLLRHYAFSIVTYLSINVFYIFGGRVNVALLPGCWISLLDFSLAALSTAWLVRSLMWNGLGKEAA